MGAKAPRVGDAGVGAHWFSVQGITDENRPARVAEAMPAFLHNLRYWQQTSGVAASATAMLGFSQGAIMALEAAQTQARLAARINALSGRYAQHHAQLLTPERLFGWHVALCPIGYSASAKTITTHSKPRKRACWMSPPGSVGF